MSETNSDGTAKHHAAGKHRLISAKFRGTERQKNLPIAADTYSQINSLTNRFPKPRGAITLMIWLVYAAVAGAILLYVFLQVKCLIGWKGRYRLLGILPIFWLISWGAIVIHTMTKDESKSDIWPFEAIAGCAPALVLLFILIMLHFINTGQWFKTPKT